MCNEKREDAAELRIQSLNQSKMKVLKADMSSSTTSLVSRWYETSLEACKVHNPAETSIYRVQHVQSRSQ